MVVWELNTPASIKLFSEENNDYLSYVVENDFVSDIMYNHISQYKNGASIEILHSAKVENLQLPGIDNDAKDHPVISIKTSESDLKVSTDLLIGADGYNSIVRKKACMQAVKWHENLKAIVGTLKMEEGFDNFIAWQRFLPNGPIALLPSRPAERNNQVGDFVENLGTSLLQRFGLVDESKINSDQPIPPKVTKVIPGSMASFPIAFQGLTRYVNGRTVLIGDAAHRVLPLAGQGFNLGFADAKCLVDKISNAVSEGSDVGGARFLLEYETERQRVVAPFSLFIDSLFWLYSSEKYMGLSAKSIQDPRIQNLISCANSISDTLVKTPFLGIRSAGLNLVDKTPVLKNFLMDAAKRGRIR